MLNPHKLQNTELVESAKNATSHASAAWGTGQKIDVSLDVVQHFSFFLSAFLQTANDICGGGGVGHADIGWVGG